MSMVIVRKFWYALLLTLTFSLFLSETLKSQVEFIGEEVTGDPGQIVCLDFTTNNFDSLVAIQFSINFDVNVIKFESANTFGNLPSFNGGDQNTACGASSFIVESCRQSDQDSFFIRVIWQALSINDLEEGLSLPDGTTLFEICFRIVNDAVPGTCSGIIINNQAFDSNSQDPEITKADLTLQPVLVVDGEICITAPDQPIPEAQIAALCSPTAGNMDGSIGIVAFGGTGPYTLENTDSGETFQIENVGEIFNINGLGDGTYNFTLTDSNNGTFDLDPITLSGNNELTLTFSEPNLPTCANLSNGSLEVSAAGGTAFDGGNYRYEWSTTLLDIGATSEARTIGNGTYSVTVTDANGCTATNEFTIDLAAITFLTDVSNNFCNDGSQVQITVTPSGGSGVYRANVLGVPFQSNFGFSGSTTFSVPGEGEYDIVVEDFEDQNCEVVNSIEIAYENKVQIIESVTNIDCETQTLSYQIAFENSDGSISTNYDYQIIDLDGPTPLITSSTGSGSSMVNIDVPASSLGYRIVVISSEGCEVTDTIPPSMASGMLSLDSEFIIESCVGNNNGSIELSVSSGSAVTFTWDTGEIIENQNNVTLSNLDTGSYVVTITNESGCLIVDTFNVPPVLLDIRSATDASLDCTEDLGDITAIVSGGVAPYNYDWDHPNGMNTEILNDVLAGSSVAVTVTDFNGCSAVTTLSLNAADAVLLELTGAPTPPTCHDSSDGTAIVSASGGPVGVSAYSYTWSDGTMNMPIGFDVNTDLPSGSHWVVAGDGECDSDTLFFEIGPGTDYKVDLVNSTIEQPTCNENNGLLIVEATPNDGNSFVFTFPDQGNIPTSNPALPMLGPGDVIVGITNTLTGCMSMDTVTIEALATVEAEIDSFASIFPLCGDEEVVATLVIDAQGGNTSSPYTYEWTNTNSTTGTASDLGIGIYSVTVTDDDGCSAEINDIEITAAQGITADVQVLDPNCTGEPGGIYVSNAMGGSDEGFSFQVNTQSVADIADTASIFPGSYTVRVFDSEGCDAEFNDIIVAEGNIITVDLAANFQNISLGTSTELEAFIGGNSVGAESIEWTPMEGLVFLNPNNTIAEATPVMNQLYEVVVTDANGCTASDEILITVNASVSLYVPNAFTLDETSQNRGMHIFAGADITSIDLVQVFDRWGNTVFQTSNLIPNILKGPPVWDGRISGKDANSGVYVYRIEYTRLNGDQEVQLGDMTLVR